jgi:hypothetical protein
VILTVTQSWSKKGRRKDLNKGILHTTLTGKLQLELEYRQPGAKGDSTRQERASTVQQLDRGYTQAQVADAFTWLLHVI